jgi:hypothetical protein
MYEKISPPEKKVLRKNVVEKVPGLDSMGF